MQQYRNLILRANRSLGANLKELGLISDEALDSSYQKLLELIKTKEFSDANLIKILIQEGRLDENALIKSANYPPISLKNFDFLPVLMKGIDPDLCLATWTAPFSQKDGYILLATCYNFSQPVIDHWEEASHDPILWHATTPNELEYALHQVLSFQPVKAVS